MFIVTLVLNEIVAWMRSQSGTSSLRAILYMDEIFGFFPPSANPPSKLPMLTLLKQGARLWPRRGARDPEPGRSRLQGSRELRHVVHRALQTERDKLRVIEGLKSAHYRRWRTGPTSMA
jgi:hypothetical protein